MAITYLNKCVKVYNYDGCYPVRHGVTTIGEYESLEKAVPNLRIAQKQDPEGNYYLSKIPTKKWKKSGGLNDMPIPSRWRDDKEEFSFKISQQHLLRLPLEKLEEILENHLRRLDRVQKAIETKKNGTENK